MKYENGRPEFASSDDILVNGDQMTNLNDEIKAFIQSHDVAVDQPLLTIHSTEPS